jgi:glycosyltransferase involved in cell wall biosynthesis
MEIIESQKFMSNDSTPKVSIVIVTYNRLKTLKNLLSKFIEVHTVHFQFELIIIFNGGMKKDFIAFNEFLRDKIFNFSVTSILIQDSQVHVSRNLGVMQSKSEVLCFLDDDVEILQTWLPAVEDLLESNDFGVVGGPAIPEIFGFSPSWFWALFTSLKTGWINEWFSLIDLRESQNDVDHKFIFGQNLLIKKSDYFELGGFHPDAQGMKGNEKFIGDGETGLLFAAQEAGLKIRFDQNFAIKHHLDSDRITFNYISERAYSNGISISFFCFRNNKSIFLNFYFVILKRILFLVSLTIYRLPFILISTPDFLNLKDLNKVWRIATLSFVKGYFYHRKLLRNDVSIRKHVKRKNFF